jgi:signal transduction histidine kinase
VLQHHHDPIAREATSLRPPRPQHLEILDGIARELMPAVWGLGVQCSVLRLPADLTLRERQFIDGVEQHAGRITRVLAAVHDLLLAETDGELPLDPRPADIAAICDDAVAQLREAGIEDEIVREDEGSGEGVWDAERLSEAVSYLLECALHAGPDDAGVALRWRGRPGEIVITIERSAGPGEARRGIDLEFGAAIGAGPEESVKAAVARRVILQHGGTLARFATGRSVAYVVLLPRRAPEDLD